MNQHRTSGRALLPEERRQRIIEHLRDRGTVSITMLEREFGISAMTARRDLDLLESEGKLRRTYGGAVLPELSAHEDSFQARVERDAAAKERLAAEAVKLCTPGSTIFLDSSSSAYFLAKHLAERGPAVTVLTNCLPTMNLLASANWPDLNLVGLGGSLRKLTQSFVGPQTIRAINDHVVDLAIMSTKGITPDGYVTDPDPYEAEVKRHMAERGRQTVLLMDGSKLRQSGLCVVTTLARMAVIVATNVNEDDFAELPYGDAQLRIV